MIATATPRGQNVATTGTVPATLLAGLRDHLDAEIAVVQRLLILGEAKQKAIVAADRPALEAVLLQERPAVEESARLRKLRDRLVSAMAGHLCVPPSRITVSAVLAAVDATQRPAPADRQAIAERQQTLVGLLERLRACNERNLMLIRGSLGFVQDLLNVILGQPGGERAYDQHGEAGTPAPSGRMLDLKG